MRNLVLLLFLALALPSFAETEMELWARADGNPLYNTIYIGDNNETSNVKEASYTIYIYNEDPDEEDGDKGPARRGNGWLLAGGTILMVAGAVGGIAAIGLGSAGAGALILAAGLLGGTGMIVGSSLNDTYVSPYAHNTQPPSYVPSHTDTTATETDTLSATTIKEQPDNLLPNPDYEAITKYKGLYSNACSRSKREVGQYESLCKKIEVSSNEKELHNLKEKRDLCIGRLQSELRNLKRLREQIYFYGGPGVPDAVESRIEEIVGAK